MMMSSASAALALALSLLSAASLAAPSEPQCRAWPAEGSSWPSQNKWKQLNTTVGGRLITSVPPAAFCHRSFEGKTTYDAAKCSDYIARITEQPIKIENPVDIEWPWWSNNTCAPTDNPDTPCTIGTFPKYVIRAQNSNDVKAGVDFARENNVRLVIKNTGHDFMGKSTGAGSLSIWTHHLKDIEIINKYNDPSTSYKGSAVKLGSGWQGGDIYKLLEQRGKTIVGGECAYVGFSGGYIQGGGHGPLSSIYGMAADSALQFTLVTAAGKIVTADAKQNPDIFYALRGGGGAAFGVVLSVTVKTYDTPSFSALSLNFTDSNADRFWAGLEAFHSYMPEWSEKGAYGYYEIVGTPGGPIISIQPLLVPKMKKAAFTTLVTPLLKKLTQLGINYTHAISEHPTFYQGYTALFAGEPAGANMLTGSRLILKQHVKQNNAAVTAGFRNVIDTGRILIGHVVSPTPAEGTSTNPVWRDGLLLPLYNVIFTGNETEDDKWRIIRETLAVDQKLKDASPGSGTYINEANIYEPNWREDFYGKTTYPKLLAIKKKWDPKGVFWAKTAVGSGEWAEVNGRLCKTGLSG